MLITKELSGEISAEEREQLQQLLQSQPVLRTQYADLRAFWEEEASLSYQGIDAAFKKVTQRIAVLEQEQEEEPAPVISMQGKRWYWKGAAAAAILLIAGAILFLANRKGGEDILASGNWQEKYTPKKVKSTIVLTDGTRVILNSDSKLKFPESFTGSKREVFLTGEAYFDVAKNANHPFIIHTPKMDIRVLGTAFNVRTYANEATSETTLIQGAIEINVADRPSDKIYLKPNDKFVLTNNAHETGKEVAATVKQAAAPSSYSLATLTHYSTNDSSDIVETSWINNKLVFRNEDFGSLAKKLERWYGVNVYFQNEQQESLRFTGVFEKESLEQALSALQLTEKFQFRIKGETLCIL
ncbi:FecR family protein [Filimonas lacunae]|uniref:FecR family protein n=1 Tax=Filimonas lacunae TaxID=477680 RepID=UPI001356388B|nr:FecR family protein [Filimonas lacunae]